ncbi:hypothetical protein [Desulfobulbus sp.]|uniref:hypothetical protein n=1 Tax=Desulfobulbus sp. TaxID=895 RepID=UPI00286EC173|nr:hypothetical protein [Desulfobulbus sp.]
MNYPIHIVRKIGIAVILLLILAMVANVLRQRFYCKTPWRECNPVALIPCEPVDRVMDQWNDYQDMAKKYGREK